MTHLGSFRFSEFEHENSVTVSGGKYVGGKDVLPLNGLVLCDAVSVIFVVDGLVGTLVLCCLVVSMTR